MTALVRMATPADAGPIAAIYGPFCTSTAVSFEEQAPSLDEMAQRIAKITQQYPWLVCEEGGKVLGYVYASRHRDRAAYRWSVDVAAYMAEGARRRGIGRRLYEMLFRLLVRQGYYKTYAGIALPNPASERLHEAVGFTAVGVYRGVGYKFGAWHDVRWYERTLQPERFPPAEARAIGDVLSADWRERLIVES